MTRDCCKIYKTIIRVVIAPASSMEDRLYMIDE